MVEDILSTVIEAAVYHYKARMSKEKSQDLM